MSEHRDIWVHVSGRRRETFERVFGTSVVPVTSPGPHTAFLPGYDEPQLVYLLDLGWVTEQGHRQALVEYIAERFGIPAETVERDLDAAGMPILASDTTVRIDNLQRWA